MPIILHAAPAVAVVATIQTITVPVERVEPIIVNEPISVQVQRCYNVPVYATVPQVHYAPQAPGVLGGVLGAVIGGGLARGDAKPCPLGSKNTKSCPVAA